MTRKPANRPTRKRASVHVSLPADVAQRLRAYAGFHGRSYADVVAEGVRLVTRGFSARQEPAPVRTAEAPAATPEPGLTLVRGETDAA